MLLMAQKSPFALELRFVARPVFSLLAPFMYKFIVRIKFILWKEFLLPLLRTSAWLEEINILEWQFHVSEYETKKEFGEMYALSIPTPQKTFYSTQRKQRRKQRIDKGKKSVWG